MKVSIRELEMTETARTRPQWGLKRAKGACAREPNRAGSSARNPDIVQVFWLREDMERVGRGTQNIVAWCREAGLPDPSWKADDAGVSLIFRYAQKTVPSALNGCQKKLLEDLGTGPSASAFRSTTSNTW